MREIKFRAWVGSEKRMELDRFYINQWDGKCHYTEPHHYEHEDKVIVYDCGEEEPILMQYTGLKDKNKVEIYEGDIMAWESYEGTKNQTRWVVEITPYQATKSWNSSRPEDAIVIGNIHQNPELLTP